jgi:fatty-acyl-CoA synthase
LTEEGIIAACAGRLSAFKTPKRVILTDALPKNPTGKLLKRELRRLHAPVSKAE